MHHRLDMSIVVEAAAIGAGAGGVAWTYLLAFRNRFWCADQRLQALAGTPPPDAGVVAVMPARNEAAIVGQSVASLLQQTLAPAIRLVLVDDESDDDTQRAARDAARSCGAADRLIIISGAPRPAGWTGKMWAVFQGVRVAERLGPRYLLLTDADIRHDPDAVRQLVMKAEADRLDLVSLMVRLHCSSFLERLLIPPFVLFFQKLYPFRAVNDPQDKTAAAAGGCMLVRADALKRAGGIEAISSELIDDCALARRMKSGGPIWLGLTERSVSLRAHIGLRDIWHMVARTAYTQLGYSPVWLVVTVAGMMLVYLTAPAAVLVGAGLGSGMPAILGAAVWLMMCVAYAPTLKLYGLSLLWAPTLPVSALLYTMMTIDSAYRHWRRREVEWRGRLNGGLAPMLACDKRPGPQPSVQGHGRWPSATRARNQ